jgi:peptide-methionine (S)-S-oxide reductase
MEIKAYYFRSKCKINSNHVVLISIQYNITLEKKMKYISKNYRRAILGLALVIVASGMLSDNFEVSAKQEQSSAVALFAGGCFWCMEPPFDTLDGVISTISGYTGGHTQDPTYKKVSSDTTGHYEALQVTYDPSKVNYATLLNVFWHNIDPLDANGQFCDKGKSYRTAIFYTNDEQKTLAENSKKELIDANLFKEEVVTVIEAAQTFYPAEDYHQDYYQKNPVRYKYYRFSCGRDKRLKELWKDAAGKGGNLLHEMTRQ